MSQFKALMYKNWILFKRSWLGSLLEIFIPIIFVLMVLLIRNLATVTDYAQTQYVDKSSLSLTLPGLATSSYIPNILKSCQSNIVDGSLQRNGYIALAHSGDALIALVYSQLISLGYTAKNFTSDAAVDSYVRDPNYGQDSDHPRLCFGISVDSSSGNYQYNLRYNVTGDTSSEGPSTQVKSTLDVQFSSDTIRLPQYSGMLQINNILLNQILQKETNSSEVINQVLSPMTQEAYYSDPIYSYLGNSMDILCLLPLLIVYLRQISVMLNEKEKKIRETMKIMGMSNTVYYLTWFVRYFIVYVVIHLVCSIIIARALPVINFGVIFVLFLIFDILLIIQAFFIQTFFTSSKLGMVIGLLFFLIQYVMSFITANSNNPTVSQYVYVSISPHAAFITALREILYADSYNINLTFGQASSIINYYQLSTAYISIFIHIIVWTVLFMYLEQVFPNEWGAKRHPCFFLSCFWKKQTEQERQAQDILIDNESMRNIQSVENKYIEMQKANQTIKFRRVNKQFDNGRKAVRDLNLTIYNDQIFVLLGHNGAGKTTTISMLTGLLEPSSGRIEALGYDTSTEMDQLRSRMGVCPQHDTLYEQLTVEQHLYLFGTFKGYDSKLLDDEVKKLIKDVNLEQKTDYYAKDLSGGQKRRLSVALSFVGGSKLIFLDEPTSGMDTSARRYIWQMMKDYKNDRIIILTTHFMDEADFLGDRIGIMGDGKLICAGSSIFLKNKFGVGYNITIVKEQNKVDSNKIIEMIHSIIPSAKVTTNVSAQIAIQLGMEDIDKFPKMFDTLDNNKKNLGIESYGVSITTLQEVFMKVAEISHKEEENDVEVVKDVQMVKNNKIVVPEESGTQLDINSFEDQGTFIRHLTAILLKRYRITKRDWKSLAFQFIFPIVLIILALFLLRVSFIVDLPSQNLTLNVFQSQGFPLTLPISGNDTTVLSTIATYLSTTYSSKITVSSTSSQSTATGFDTNIVLPQKSSALKAAIYVLPISGSSFTFYNLINTRSPTSPFVFSNLVAQAYINSFTSGVTITAVNKPFPRTNQQLQINNTISGFFGAFIFSVALAFKFASIMSFIVKERQDKCKHQQIVSGMSIYSYWFGNYIYDLGLYLLVAIFGAGMCQAFGISSLVNGDALTATWVLFILYGLSNIPFTYLLSFLFKDYGNSQAGCYFFNFVAGGIVSVIILLLRFISTSTSPIGRGLAWALRLIPAYCFGEGLMNQGSIALLGFSQLGKSSYSVFDISITLAPIIYMAIEVFVYFALLFLVEHLINSQNFMRFFTSQNSIPYHEITYDQDVLVQMNKANLANPQDHTIITKNLRKVYMLDSARHKVAVDKLSFTVNKGDVFGLLGVNGAGKTTTFKMLAGQITSTSGDAYFNGMKISQNLSKVRRSLGYCPQFDALLENLTVREQLELYYDMKGLPIAQKDKLINIKINQLNLLKYQNTLSGTLSGGNKRKLSVACAIIGDPTIIFLDEPSTGMDPEARRFMWRVISSIATEKKQSTVILTTHSMEEAEALSTRLGIMVNGNFKCIGTPQHIKSKFGEGYELEIKILLPTDNQIKQRLTSHGINSTQIITENNIDEIVRKLCPDELIRKEISANGSGKYLVKQVQENKIMVLKPFLEFIMIEERGKVIENFIQTKMGEKELIEHYQAFYRYRLKTKTAIGKIFGLFQQYKAKLLIQQYSIKQATVQQIFNKFASTQIADEDS